MPSNGNTSFVHISEGDRDNDPLSLMQFALSSLAALCLCALSLILVIMGIMNMVNGETVPGGALQIFMAAGASAACSFLMLPSALFSLGRIRGKVFAINVPDRWWLRPTTMIIALPAVLLTGYLAAQVAYIAWFVLPVMHVLAIGLPVLFTLYLGVRGLQTGSPQRKWGVFDSGLVLGPFLIMVAEVIAFGAAVFIGAIFLMNKPEVTQEIMVHVEWLVHSAPAPDQILERMAPLLTQPAVLMAVLVFAAALVPLIEEALKPIGVWLLAGREVTPVEGFTAGLLSGAGYAFFESLALSSTGEDWIMVVTARAGTAVIHILTTGLMGWAMVSAWKGGKYFRLAVTYLGVAALHGLWNGLTLFTAYTVLAGELVEDIQLPSQVSSIGNAAPVFLGLLTLGAFLVLVLVNRTLRDSQSIKPGGGTALDSLPET